MPDGNPTLPIFKYLSSRNSYGCPIWIFIFDNDEAQIYSVTSLFSSSFLLPCIGNRQALAGCSLFPSSVKKEGTGSGWDLVTTALRSSLLRLLVVPIGGHGHYALFDDLFSRTRWCWRARMTRSWWSRTPTIGSHARPSTGGRHQVTYTVTQELRVSRLIAGSGITISRYRVSFSSFRIRIQAKNWQRKFLTALNKVMYVSRKKFFEIF